MNIIIISDQSFYNSTAQENRQLAYAKGFRELSHFVKILTLAPVEQLEKKKLLNDVEIDFLNRGRKRRNFFLQKFNSVMSSLKLSHAIILENKKRKVNCIIIQTFSSIPIFFLYFITRSLRIKYIRDQTEYPYIHKPAYGAVRLFLHTNYFYKLFDGLVVVNDALMNYFRSRIRTKAKMMKFPMIVDPERFQKSGIKSTDNNYIAYCGDMRNNKDGIPLLIEAFNIVYGKHPNIKLYLIGNTDGINEVDEFKQKIKELELCEEIVFTGKISRDEMPDYLSNATLLVLARPNNKQAEGGFPTKLGEYLATGRPVVVTRVGEIPEYLTDGVNAFLSEPDDAKNFAAKLNYALSNPELANEVGLNGKKLVYTTFNYKLQTQNLVNFINNLN